VNNKQPKSNTRFFKTDPRPLGQFAEGDIDAESGIIRNVVMCQEGEAKGHGVHLEGEFIEALAKYDRNSSFHAITSERKKEEKNIEVKWMCLVTSSLTKLEDCLSNSVKMADTIILT